MRLRLSSHETMADRASQASDMQALPFSTVGEKSCFGNGGKRGPRANSTTAAQVSSQCWPDSYGRIPFFNDHGKPEQPAASFLGGGVRGCELQKRHAQCASTGMEKTVPKVVSF